MKYEDIRDEMNDCDLLLWRGNGIIARLIQLTGEYYNHASLVVLSDKYSTKRILLYEALMHGIEPTFLSVRLNRYYGSCYWFPLKRKYESYRAAFYQAANNYAGTEYDYKSLFRNIFGYVSVDVEKLFCSEYVYIAGLDGSLPGKSNLQAPRPDDLLELDWWEKGIEIT